MAAAAQTALDGSRAALAAPSLASVHGLHELRPRKPFHFLFVALFARALDRDDAIVPWKQLCLCAALSAVTRADSFLLFLPALAWLWLSDVKRARYGQMALGASPLFAWLAFALFYYGSIFPNPKYAKLNGAVPHAQYRELGFSYLVDIARNDMVTFLVLVPRSRRRRVLDAEAPIKESSPARAALCGPPLGSAALLALRALHRRGLHGGAPLGCAVLPGGRDAGARAARLRVGERAARGRARELRSLCRPASECSR